MSMQLRFHPIGLRNLWYNPIRNVAAYLFSNLSVQCIKLNNVWCLCHENWQVTIYRSEYLSEGYTMTREDGWFDFMVNGGGAVTLQFGKSPFPPKIETLFAPWNEVRHSLSPDTTQIWVTFECIKIDSKYVSDIIAEASVRLRCFQTLCYAAF